MRGIERIAKIPEGFAVVPLPSAIEPDGNEREERKPLLAELKLQAEEREGIELPTEQLHIDPVERGGLCGKLPPPPPAEKVKGEHRPDTGTVVIHHAEQTEDIAQQDHEHADRHIEPFLPLFSCAFHHADAKQTEEQRPDDILVEGIEPGAAVHQIERELGEERERQHPQRVAPEAVRVEVALHRHEGEHREGEAARAGQPLLPRQERGPEVVHEHEGHREEMQRRGAEIKLSFHSGNSLQGRDLSFSV